jgi:hypothetical protein
MEEINNNVNESFLNGIQVNSEIPPYFITDSQKILKVNYNATGLEWSNETKQDGFKASQGDGITNTSESYEGFVFNTNETTGLFNYGPLNETLGIRINGTPIIESESNKIYLNENLIVKNDTMLTSARIGFGTNQKTFITGDSTTNNENKISFSTDNVERLRISSDNNILCKSRIQIDPSLITSIAEPHIYRDGTFLMGITLDTTYGTINFSSSSGNSMVEFNRQYIDLKEPVIFRNPIAPYITIVENNDITVNANLQGSHTYYLKRGTINHSTLTFPQPASGFNPRYEIIVDANGNPSFNCRISTLSNDVITLIGGGRTLQTGPVVNFSLTLNSHWIMQFIESDNRWLLIRTTQ